MKLSKIGSFSQTYQAETLYKRADAILRRDIVRSPQTKTAVVVHLYYIESWDLIIAGLRKLTTPFDLFVSIPAANQNFATKILADHEQAHIYEVPNRGRDVLPFIKLATILDDKGYQNVLKLHSKKSSHRKDGNEWLGNIIAGLLPDSKPVLDKLMQVLDDQSTGIVGPENQYLQLTVNFEANGVHMTKALKAIYHDRQKVNKTLQVDRANYGFFAGTMFWARLDAIRPVISQRFGVNKFVTEAGQIDGTFAHALERVFCLVPEIDGKSMYESGARGVNKVDYKTNNVPDWSDVYIGPKPLVD